MSVTPITKESPAPERDLVSEASVHLSYVKAIADILRTLAQANMGADCVDELSPVSLECAMYCIRHHTEAAEEINVELASESAARREVAHG